MCLIKCVHLPNMQTLPKILDSLSKSTYSNAQYVEYAVRCVEGASERYFENARFFKNLKSEGHVTKSDIEQCIEKARDSIVESLGQYSQANKEIQESIEQLQALI